MKSKAILTALTGFFALINCVKAQDTTSAPTAGFSRSGYSVEYIKDYITLRLSANTDAGKLAVESGDYKIDLRPNANYYLLPAINYKFISASIKYIPSFLPGNDDNESKGNTKSIAFALNYNRPHFMQQLFFSKIKGYYVHNTADLVPEWKEGDPYEQIPSLQNIEIGGMTGYSFNENFSMNAVQSQSERQARSAGSLIPRISYRYYVVDKKAPVVTSTQKSDNLELSVGAGYYYTFVLKRYWYIAAGAVPSAGIIFCKLTTRYLDENIYTHQQNTVFRADVHAGIGYNGRRFFAGLYAFGSDAWFKQGSSVVVTQNESFSAQLFIGYRLNAPGWLKKTWNNTPLGRFG